MLWLSAPLGDLREHHRQLDLLDAAIARLRLRHRRLRKSFRLVRLLQRQERLHFRAVGHEGESRFGVFACELEGSFHVPEGDRSVSGQAQPLSDRAHVTELATDVAGLLSDLIRLLYESRRLTRVAFEKGDHSQLAVGAVHPACVTEIASDLPDLTPVAFSMVSVRV
jgi:hypothetical protein